MGDGSENLIPFQEGFDIRRARGKGRPPILDSPEKLEQFARAVSEGLSGVELADMFKCNVRTARDYKKDPRIKAAVMKFIEARVERVTRKTDTEIEKRLANPGDLTVEEILKIRKEFLGGALRAQTTGDSKDGKTINDAAEALEQNPEMAVELQELLARAKAV